MTDLKKILVATDFSEGAEAVYPVAEKLASTFGSRVDLIHIIPTLSYLNESMRAIGTAVDISREIYPKVIEESENLCKKALESFIDKPNRGEGFVKVHRKPAEAIVEFAAENNYDLIMIGAKGKDLTHLLRGSTTERVIRSSTIPVFSVNKSFSEDTIEHILVPTDTSELSFSAFPLAAAIASTYGASLTLFHIVELFGIEAVGPTREHDSNEFLPIYEMLIERLNNFLDDNGLENLHIQRSGVVYEDELVITEEGKESKIIPVTTKIDKGISAHFEIESYAEENADLVVIATHGHTGLAHLILGSTTEKVAQYASKPVITIRPEKKKLKNRSS